MSVLEKIEFLAKSVQISANPVNRNMGKWLKSLISELHRVLEVIRIGIW